MKKNNASIFSQTDITPPHEILYISPHPFERDSLFYRVNRAGVVRRTTNTFHIRRNETYRFGVVHCVFGGRGSVIFRKKEYALREGMLFLLPPYERHEYKSDPSDPLGLCFVEFYGGNTAQMSDYILAHAAPIFDGSAFFASLTFMTSILSRLEHDDWLNVNLDLYGLLTNLCANLRNEDGDREGIVGYVREHITQNLSLASLSKRFGYHPAYFSRKFRQLTGMTLSQYILGRRVSRACYLLITTEMPLEEISESLGFYDVSHMITRFKQLEGVTPAQYRRQNRGLMGKLSNAPDQ